jgi:hypothetical protein
MGDINTCKQRQLFLMGIASLPKNRIEMVSPYPNFTESQLNMRRKVEILQHTKNSSKGDQQSKSQKFARSINKNANTILNNCTSDLYLPSLTSSCDVPGPIITLQYDPSVPLYNYAQNINAYGQLSSDIIFKWLDKTYSNIPAYNNVETTFIDSLAIGTLDTNPTTFTINTPIGIYIEGSVAGNTISGNVSLSNISVLVYYNNQQLNIIQPTIQLNGVAVSESVDYTVTTPGIFNGSQYIGNLTISNLVLPTQYGFTYSIKILCNTNESVQIGNSSFKSGIVLNLTEPTLLNCSFGILSPSPPIQTPYGLSSLGD